jgi:HSP20 family molecular chaperone IbpA
MLGSEYPLLPQNFLGEDVAPLFRSFRRAVDSMLKEPWEPSPVWSVPREFYPQVSVSEDERQIRVQAELPGLKESDVEIVYEPGYLTVRGEKKQEEKRETDTTRFSECRYGSFERRIPLRSEVQEGQIQANFDRGVLTISLPKTEAARAQARRIPIKAGAPQQLESGSGKTRIQPSSEGAQASH